MRMIPLIAALLLVPACQDRAAPPGAPESSQAAASAPAPEPAQATAEVTHLAKRIEACEHFAGEEPYDAARAEELRRQVEANCPGNDAELARLRRQHAANPAIKRQLDRLGQQQR